MKNVIEKRLIREEVPTELTWDLSDFIQSDEEWAHCTKCIKR